MVKQNGNFIINNFHFNSALYSSRPCQLGLYRLPHYTVVSVHFTTLHVNNLWHYELALIRDWSLPIHIICTPSAVNNTVDDKINVFHASVKTTIHVSDMAVSQVSIISPTGCILRFLFDARISTSCKTVLELSSSSTIIIVTGRVYHFYSTTYKGHWLHYYSG